MLDSTNKRETEVYILVKFRQSINVTVNFAQISVVMDFILIWKWNFTACVWIIWQRL